MSVSRKRTRSIGEMKIEKMVGSGTFGVVYKALDKSESQPTYVALKKIKMERETQGFPVTAIREIKTLNLMKNHKNIVTLREVVTFGETETEPSVIDKGFDIGDVFMVFEFVDYDLSGLLKSSSLKLTDKHIKSYLYQLLSGVAFLHENKILHRDIKSANLLVSRQNVLKIADWGLARTVDADVHKLTNPVVTLWYRSPELILGSKQYNGGVDVWSVGCIFGEMQTGMAMFRGESEVSQLDLVFQLTGSPKGELLDLYARLPDWEKINFTKDYENRIKKNLSGNFHHNETALDLLESLLNIDYPNRISAHDALKHPYFTQGDIPRCEDLPEIDVEPVTEWMEQERQRKRHEEMKEAHRRSQEEKARLNQQVQVEQQRSLQVNNGGYIHQHRRSGGRGRGRTNLREKGKHLSGGMEIRIPGKKREEKDSNGEIGKSDNQS